MRGIDNLVKLRGTPPRCSGRGAFVSLTLTLHLWQRSWVLVYLEPAENLREKLAEGEE
jgi:hypothetical protein